MPIILQEALHLDDALSQPAERERQQRVHSAATSSGPVAVAVVGWCLRVGSSPGAGVSDRLRAELELRRLVVLLRRLQRDRQPADQRRTRADADISGPLLTGRVSARAHRHIRARMEPAAAAAAASAASSQQEQQQQLAAFWPYNAAAQPYAGLPTGYFGLVGQATPPAPPVAAAKARRPRSAFLFFMAAHRKKMQAAFPDLAYLAPATTAAAADGDSSASAPAAGSDSGGSGPGSTPALVPNPSFAFSSLSQLLGHEWRHLPAEKRQVYERMSDDDKARYRQEMELLEPEKAKGVRLALEKKERQLAGRKRKADAKEKQRAKKAAAALAATAKNAAAAAAAEKSNHDDPIEVEADSGDNPFTVAPTATPAAP